MAWGLFREDCHRVTLSPNGVVLGVNYSRALARMRLAGLGMEEAELLLAACERGLMLASSEAKEERHGEE